MINTVNQFVNKINQSEKDLAVMNERIFEIEKTKLNEIIEVAKNGLLFEPIYENATGQDVDYYDEVEYFHNKEEEILMGHLIYTSGEFYEETDDGDREISTELFLLEDGSIKIFHTYSESCYCEECEEFHGHSHRIVAEDQTLNRFNIKGIINNIVTGLKIRASNLEKRKQERTEKLEELKKAI